MVAERTNSVASVDGTTIAIRSIGRGEGVIVVGGALRTGEDYLPFARSLAEGFAAHVVDRRGRGLSGPLGPDYSIDRECDDLLAVQAATGATRVFGHSYGALVALQTAARSDAFAQVAVYEPGVSVGGSIPAGWLNEYERMLGDGDPRGAFAVFVRGSGHAPAALAGMPTWYSRLILRAAVRGRRWQQVDPLLAANLAEHREVARLDGVVGYARITAPVLLLAGSRSPHRQTEALRELHAALPHAAYEIMDGLDHLAPDEKAPEAVAARVASAFGADAPPRRPQPAA